MLSDHTDVYIVHLFNNVCQKLIQFLCPLKLNVMCAYVSVNQPVTSGHPPINQSSTVGSKQMSQN